MRGFNIIDSSHLELRDRTKISRMFKGKVRLDLCDALTGKVKERSEGENTFTNALDSLFNDAPFGLGKSVFGNTLIDADSTDGGDVNNSPVFERALGGVLLFPEFSNPSNLNDFYEPMSNLPTGYASMLNQSDVDDKLGTFNALESAKLSNGFKYVYDWATSAANGEIGGIALTHRRGGLKYFKDYKYMRGINGVGYYKALGAWSANSDYPSLVRGCIIGANDSGVFTINQEGQYNKSCNVVQFWRHNKTSVGLFKTWGDGTVYDSQYASKEWQEANVPIWSKKYTDGTSICYDEASNKLYVLSTAGGANSSITMITVDCASNYAETSSTISTSVNLRSTMDASAVIGAHMMTYLGGYIYAVGADGTTLYKINVSTPADTTAVEGMDEWTNGLDLFLTTDGKGVYAIATQTAHKSYYIGDDDELREIASTAQNVIPAGVRGVYMLTSRYQRSGNFMLGINPLTSYMATKYSLGSAVTKSASLTAKLQYTVTQV